MDGMKPVRAGRRQPPRRRLRLPRLVHGRPVRRRGARRRDVRAGASALAPLRPEPRARRAPGSARSRARPRSTTSAPRGAAGGARSSRPRPSGSRSGSVEGLSPELEAALQRLTAGEREVIALRVVLDLDAPTRRGDARHLPHQLHDAPQPRAREARGGTPCRGLTCSASCARRARSRRPSCASTCPPPAADAAAELEPAPRAAPVHLAAHAPGRCSRRGGVAAGAVILRQLEPARRRTRDGARASSRRRPSLPARSAAELAVARRGERAARARTWPNRPGAEPESGPARQRLDSSCASRAPRRCRTARSGRARSRMRSVATRRAVVVSAAGASGYAQLVLRIPKQHLQQAVARLSALGTIVGEHVSIRDIEGRR